MKWSVLLSLLLLISPWTSGQLLYEIKSKDGLKTSYLFGTIHVIPEDQFILSPTLKKAFESSRTLAMEVDLNMDLATKVALAKETMLPDGQTLKDITTPEQYQTIYSYWEKHHGKNKRKFNRYSRLKPFFFSSLLLQENMKHSKSYEIEWKKLAHKQEKKTMGLESVHVQMQTINTVSLPDQVKMLMDGLNNTQEYDSMLSHYLSEDLAALYQDILKESEGFPNFLENFLNKRNRQWIPILEKQLEKEATFIAVGAGHLPGEQGVISLLKAKGFTITPHFAF